MDINDIRVLKMRILVDEFGGRKALSKITGIAYPQLNNYIGKTRFKNIGNNIARRVEESCGKPRGWMDIWDEAIVETSIQNYQFPQIANQKKVKQQLTKFSLNETISIPIADREASKLTMDADLIHSILPFITNLKDLLLMRAYGDSMEGTFGDGDMLLVDQSIKKLDADAIYAFRVSTSSEIYTKRLQRQLDGSIRIISDNKKYDAIPAEQSQLEILGRIVLAWKKL